MDGRVAVVVAVVAVASALGGCFAKAPEAPPPAPPVASSFLATPEEIEAAPPPPERGEDAPPPPPDAPAYVEGLVVEKDGPALGGTRITILESLQREGETSVYAESNATGEFAFPPLRPGAYTLVPEAQGYDSLRMVVALAPAQQLYVVFELIPLPPANVTRNETWEFGGFLACGVGAAGAWAMPCITDANERTSFAVNVTWGIATLVVAVDWNAQASNSAQLGVTLRATHGLYDRPECRVLGSAKGAPPLVVRADPWCLDYAVTHEEDRDVPVTIDVGPQANESQPYTFVFQQSFKVYANAHYVVPAPEGFTGLPAE